MVRPVLTTEVLPEAETVDEKQRDKKEKGKKLSGFQHSLGFRDFVAAQMCFFSLF